jgi:uncharacterized protein YkwD
MTQFGTSFLVLSVVLLGGDEPAKKFQQTANENKLFDLTNQERKKTDLAPLKLNPALSKLARAHSENMARQGKLEHTLDEKSPFDRLRAGGYKFMKAGENIAGTGANDGSTLAMVMERWMNSKGHRANILEREFTEVGIGIARDKEGNLFYTQIFARPRK